MSHLGYQAEQIRAAKLKRDLIERAIAYVEACRNGHEPAELTEAGAALFRACLEADPAARSRTAPTTEIMRLISESSRRPQGRRVLTGIRALDRITGGIGEGEVLAIVARPQVGKSALASQIALHAARANHRTVFFSLEMPREQTVCRMLQQALGLPEAAIEEMAQKEWLGLSGALSAKVAPIRDRIVVVDRGKSGIDHLEAAMLEAESVLGGRPELAVVDYLGLLSSGAKNLPLYQRVSEAALDVKSFAKRHRIAVVLLSQSSRDQDPARSGGYGRLGLDSARDSGQVEEAVDFLLTMWRPELDPGLPLGDRPEIKGIIRAALVKNRRGQLRDFGLLLRHETVQIEELAED